VNSPTTTAATASFATLPALGTTFEGGTFCGVTTLRDGSHCAVVLLDAKPDGALTWQAGMDWARDAGGQLPTRPVAALLYANAKDQFERDWYWTSDELHHDTGNEHHSSSAWRQYFSSGRQLYNGKSYAFRCRAVRLIHLTA
jgi:hypothetical protein